MAREDASTDHHRLFFSFWFVEWMNSKTEQVGQVEKTRERGDVEMGQADRVSHVEKKTQLLSGLGAGARDMGVPLEITCHRNTKEGSNN